jgi:hypothetical protein
MNGKELNSLHQTQKEIFTPDELKNAGFVYLSWITFVTDKENVLYDYTYTRAGDEEKGRYPHVCRHYKIHGRYSHDWNENAKKDAKLDIIKNIKDRGIVFIQSVHFTTFADDMDYTGVSYNIGVLVRGAVPAVLP